MGTSLQVHGAVRQRHRRGALRTSTQEPLPNQDRDKLVEKDSGKEGEEGTGVDGETLEEVSTRNDVDEVHRCKRVSSLLRTTSLPPLPFP